MSLRMEKLWFITNSNSGTTTQSKCEAIEAVFEERGLVLAGRTLFSDEDIPTEGSLARAAVDTVVLFAGDGTINAVLCSLAEWDGAFLILPGGTMNLLAKQLHDASDPGEIIHKAHGSHTLVSLPYVEGGQHRAFVGLILGPAGHWFHARELVRANRFRRLFTAGRFAWRKTFGESVRVAGAPALRRAYQAIFVAPYEERLNVAAINARDWGSIAKLGWEWLTGDWIAAQAVTQSFPQNICVEGQKPTLALFDGEPQMLPPGTVIGSAKSAPQFICTRGEPE